MMWIVLAVAAIVGVTQGAPTETLDHVTTFERVHFRREDIMMPETRGRRALHHPGAFSLDVNAFGASYRLNLERNVNIFQKDATVSVMHGDGKVEEVTLDHMAYYTGVVENSQERSYAHMQVNLNGELSGFFHVGQRENQSYTIEPAGRHLAETTDTEHVLFRDSDFIHKVDDVSSFCGKVESPEGVISPQFAEHVMKKMRARRAVYDISRPVCNIALSADSKFLASVAGGDVGVAINVVVEHFDFAKNVFETTFNSNPLVQLEIASIRIYTSGDDPFIADLDPAACSDGSVDCDGFKFLQDFSREDPGSVCLAHLFTAYNFESNLLGLAFVGKTSNSQAGGLCQARGSTSSSNTGFTTLFNGGRLPTLQSSLVVTHELGHNFGSEHDPATSDPNAVFVMYEFAVDGSAANHDNFSPASITQIEAVVNAKGGCFIASAGEVCGNARASGSEECDCGTGSCAGIDDCCNDFDTSVVADQCTVKTGNQCSPQHLENGICCLSNCMFKTGNCREETDCKNAAVCSTGVCPTQTNKAANTRCGGNPNDPTDSSDELQQSKLCDAGGECLVSICTLFQTFTTPCAVTHGATACNIACTDGATCTPFASVPSGDRTTFPGFDFTLAYQKPAGDPCEFELGEPLSGVCDDSSPTRMCIPAEAEKDIQDKVEDFVNNVLNSDLANRAKDWALDSSYGVKNYVWLIIGGIFFFALLAACGCFKGKRSGAASGPKHRGRAQAGNKGAIPMTSRMA